MNLSDQEWAIIEPLIPPMKSGPGKRGRPARPARDVLNAILWVLRTGSQWNALPECYPPYQTCHDRLQLWRDQGVMKKIMRALAQRLKKQGHLDLSEAFIDGTFVPAKKGAQTSARPSGERARR